MTDFAQAFEGARWVDVVRRRDACPGLSPLTLLHAGPPLTGPLPAPLANAAVQAALFEDLAADESDARSLIAQGVIQLLPAQDHGVVTPLAQVVSASMPLMAVRLKSQVSYGAMLEGGPPALRFGAADPACRQRMRRVRDRAEHSIAPLLRSPVDIATVIRYAVAAGDDCHSRTAAANAALLAALSGLDHETEAYLRAQPAFVLPLIMAAAAAALRAHRSDIEAIGGNGVHFGIRRRAEREWRRVAAAPFDGTRLPGHESTPALPAVGDSVLIDFCGLGGQVDAPALRHALIDAATGIVDPRHAASAGAPRLNLAMVAADGHAGMIGRGCYTPPAALFAERSPCVPG